MKLEFAKGPAIEDPSNADIASELLKVGGERGAFAILSEADHEYMQAGRRAGNAEKFTLEYREEGKQYQAVDAVSGEEAVAAFQDYAWGKSVFQERHRWRELDLSTGDSGCVGIVAVCFVLLLSLATTAL